MGCVLVYSAIVFACCLRWVLGVCVNGAFGFGCVVLIIHADLFFRCSRVVYCDFCAGLCD